MKCDVASFSAREPSHISLDEHPNERLSPAFAALQEHISRASGSAYRGVPSLRYHRYLARHGRTKRVGDLGKDFT